MSVRLPSPISRRRTIRLDRHRRPPTAGSRIRVSRDKPCGAKHSTILKSGPALKSRRARQNYSAFLDLSVGNATAAHQSGLAAATIGAEPPTPSPARPDIRRRAPAVCDHAQRLDPQPELLRRPGGPGFEDTMATDLSPHALRAAESAGARLTWSQKLALCRAPAGPPHR
jgi:hypothetical protein